MEDASNALKNHKGVIYGLYYDYASDFKGDYTLSVAIESSKDEASMNIPATNKYRIFEVDSSDESGIVNTWKKIWELEEKRALERAYSFDFEKYYPNGEIEIHIAIK